MEINLNQTPVEEPHTMLTLQLYPEKKSGNGFCLCDLNDRDTMKVKVINDLRWRLVFFTEIEEMSFNYIDRTALFEVIF